MGHKKTDALLALFYLGFTVVMIVLLHDQVGWRRTHVTAHGIVLALGITLPLLLAAINPQRWTTPLALGLLTGWIALHVLTVTGSLVANGFIHQNISLELLWSNAEIVFDFVHPLVIAIGLAGLVGLCYLMARALLRLFLSIPGAAQVVAPVLALVFLSTIAFLRMTPLHFSQEPVVNFFGYPGFDVLTGSFRERIQAEETLAQSYTSEPFPRQSNVIMIMADSLSPYHLKSFGYHRNTAPNLDSIVENSPFSSSHLARSTCSDSICGIVSTLTSKGYLDFASGRALKLSDVLKQQGYGVNLILASDHDYDPLLRFFFANAADFRYDRNSTKTRLNSDEIILEGLSQLPHFAGEPQFIYLFMFSPHQAGEKRPEFNSFIPTPEDDTAYRRQRELSDAELQAIKNVYDNRMLQWDHYLLQSWKILESKGYLEDALVIIVGDHGEATGQHGYYGHGMHLYEPFLLTPMIMLSTQHPLPVKPRQFVRQIDIAPTILDFLGGSQPSFWHGESLFSPKDPRYAFHEYGVRLRLRGLSCDAVTVNNQALEKYIRCQRGDEEIQRYLFHLSSDPAETNNLIEQLPQDQINQWDQLLDKRDTIINQ